MAPLDQTQFTRTYRQPLIGYKVLFRHDATYSSAIVKNTFAGYRYDMEGWNYAVNGPFFLFESMDSAERFTRQAFTSESHEIVRAAYYRLVPIRRKPVILVPRADMSDARNFWTGNLHGSRATWRIPNGTVLAAAIHLGAVPTDPDLDALYEVYKLFDRDVSSGTDPKRRAMEYNRVWVGRISGTLACCSCGNIGYSCHPVGIPFSYEYLANYECSTCAPLFE